MDAEGLNTLLRVLKLLSEVHNQLEIVPNNLLGGLVVLL